jgi:hypothetical protein
MDKVHKPIDSDSLSSLAHDFVLQQQGSYCVQWLVTRLSFNDGQITWCVHVLGDRISRPVMIL